MPLYDFRCVSCGSVFDEFAAVGAVAPCPACGSEEVRRVYSRFVGPFTVGAHGGEARRSDAQRHAREEQRREEWQQQRDARETGKKPPARRVDDTPWWRKVPGSL